jgi:hypothetical protein
VIASVSETWSLPTDLQDIVVEAYVRGLEYTHGISCFLAPDGKLEIDGAIQSSPSAAPWPLYHSLLWFENMLWSRGKLWLHDPKSRLGKQTEEAMGVVGYVDII